MLSRMTHRTPALAAAVVAVALLASACMGGMMGDGGRAATPPPYTGPPPDVTIDVAMGDNFFQPSALEVRAGDLFRIDLANDGRFVHNMRVAGPDGAYDTGDDLVSVPDVQQSGEAGWLVGRIDAPGVYAFRCDFHPIEMTGTITVR